MDDKALAVRYAPLIHYDVDEPFPLVAVGYTVFREERCSDSFPKRTVCPDPCGLVIEYAFFWDYDIQHMYDLEHIWVYVAADGRVTRAEGSFHGKYMTLYEPGLPYGRLPEGRHVHAFCQPGKHAFLPEGDLFRLIPGWLECCDERAGGGVLVGGPFEGKVTVSEDTHLLCTAHIRDTYAFRPTLTFGGGEIPPEELLCPWESLKAWIPVRISQLCRELPEP